MNLEGKKILIFYPFGATKHYGDNIIRALEKKGAKVTAYDERPSQNSIAKIVIRVFKKRIPTLFSVYIKKIILENKKNEFDYILVCRGEAFTKLSISLLRNRYPKAVLILYLWDTLKTTNMQDVIPFFDKVLSFDPEDSQNYNLKFRPTFFVPAYKDVIKKNILNDIVFIGTLHSNRYNILENYKAYFNKQNIAYYYYLYLPSLLVLLKKKFIERSSVRIKDLHFKPLSLKDTLTILESSKCILDINFTGQKSLSTRAYEAMASRTKYITTNAEIKKYDFYNPNNILLIETDKINIPTDFLNSEFNNIPDGILKKYSVDQLIIDIFS